jgi:Plasmid pRiA4b ORF-3-like protein
MQARSDCRTCSGRAGRKSIGGSWEHRLTVSNVRAGNADRSYPRYVRGERNGPPEDCGGLPGFYAKLDAVADPADPDHDEIKEWIGDYNEETIDEARIERALGRIASRKQRGKARTGEKKSA